VYAAVNLAIDDTANLGSMTAPANSGLSVSLAGGTMKGTVRPEVVIQWSLNRSISAG